MLQGSVSREKLSRDSIQKRQVTLTVDDINPALPIISTMNRQ